MIFEPGKKKHLFLYTSSTDIDALLTSLYQCVETPILEIFWLVSATSAPPFQLLRHQRNASRPRCEPLYATNISHRKQETFLYEYPLNCVILTAKKRTTERCSLVVHSSNTVSFWLLKPASEYAHARLLPRLSLNLIILLPSDTYRKPVTSITGVLLPFVTYLLTPSYNFYVRFEINYFLKSVFVGLLVCILHGQSIWPTQNSVWLSMYNVTVMAVTSVLHIYSDPFRTLYWQLWKQVKVWPCRIITNTCFYTRN
jgi:hypothetical protein